MLYLFLRWLGTVPSASTIDVPTFAPQLSGESQPQMSSSSTAPVSSNKAPSFDPIAGNWLGSSNISSNSNLWTCYDTDSSVARLLRRSSCGWRDSSG